VQYAQNSNFKYIENANNYVNKKYRQIRYNNVSLYNKYCVIIEVRNGFGKFIRRIL
jgi:hypothetical protein